MSRFELGRMVATPGAIEVMTRLSPDGDHGSVAAQYLARHHAGDWGDLDAEDSAFNDKALEYGERLTSVYGHGEDRLYVITEADRSVTTILTPGEY